MYFRSSGLISQCVDKNWGYVIATLQVHNYWPKLDKNIIIVKINFHHLLFFRRAIELFGNEIENDLAASRWPQTNCGNMLHIDKGTLFIAVEERQ